MNKLAVLIVGCFIFICLTAEIWSNSAPLLMKYQGQYFTPAFKNVPAARFGIRDRLRVDYRTLQLNDDDWAIWAPNRWSPQDMNLEAESYPLKPTIKNWLGSDDRGRDVFARLLYGGRLTLIFSISVWLPSSLIAILVGGVAGYLGGWVDLISQRAIEIFSTVPQLFILIFLVTIFSPSMTVIVAVNVLFGWITLSYYVRAEALKIRGLEYVQAATVYGASRSRILLRHVLPNAIAPVVTLSPFILIGNVTALTALDFLGLGLPPPSPSWGEMLAQGQVYFATAWWLAVFPTALLFILLLAIATIGEELRG